MTHSQLSYDSALNEEVLGQPTPGAYPTGAKRQIDCSESRSTILISALSRRACRPEEVVPEDPAQVLVRPSAPAPSIQKAYRRGEGRGTEPGPKKPSLASLRNAQWLRSGPENFDFRVPRAAPLPPCLLEAAPRQFAIGLGVTVCPSGRSTLLGKRFIYIAWLVWMPAVPHPARNLESRSATPSRPNAT